MTFRCMRSCLSLLAALLFGLGGSLHAAPDAHLSTDTYGGRGMFVYVPAQLPPTGTRALVVVLHGGLGNAQRIAYGQSESGLNMDSLAEKNGFVVAYLNGTPVTRRFGANLLGWNAGGGCCGQSFENNIDDVAYIQGAVTYLRGKYGIDAKRVYGMGHSNGAMMTQRLICEIDLFAAGVAVAGPLNLDVASCSAARGKRILAIHGAIDKNVPVAGGRGAGLSDTVFASEQHSREIMLASGATYDLELVPGADHAFKNIDAALEKTEGKTVAEKAARFFGLLPEKH